MLLALDTETAYSFKGSSITLESLFDEAIKNQTKTLAIADYNMHAVFRFYSLCETHHINPIVGLHITVEPLLNGESIHCLVFAKNEDGYQNLLKLASINSLQPTITFSQLKHYETGLSIVLIPYQGELYQALTQGEKQSVKAITHEFMEKYTSVFVGVHPEINGEFEHIKPLPLIKKTALNENALRAVSVLSEIFNTKAQPSVSGLGEKVNRINDFDELAQEHLKTFIKEHTLKLKQQKAQLPRFETPKGAPQANYLKALAYKGLERRLKGKNVNKEIYRKRLDKELKTIHELGYDDYFLIVYDVIKFARNENVLVGPGRGSAPGSLVSFVLGITSVDPLEHGLLFERFLNKARQTMPDIDMDFPDTKREILIQYVANKYGKNHVANICTFGTFLSKSALRDTARILNIDKKYIEEILKYVGEYDSVSNMMEEHLDVQNRMQQLDSVKDWLEVAALVEGLPRHVSTHAAGIILADKPLSEYTALQEGLAGLYQTQYAQNDLEKMGLLKIDFLGLRNLSMIESVVELVKKHENKSINVYKLPLDDEKTFKLLRDFSTTGIFQLESRGMRHLVKRMRMQSFEDIVTVLALFRPGPMESINQYLSRRHQKENVTYLSKELEPILKDTQGILLYQEQIMAIATGFAGYSLNEADILRRAVSKKDAYILEKERINFIRHAEQNHKDKTLANTIYDYIVKFANYGFNKSHSVAYAMVAYWMAYLKANHPAAFIAVLMQSALNNEKALKEYMQEAYAHKIQVFKPSINLSKEYFVLSKNTLHYPLSGIKNIGNQTVKSVLKERESGLFKSFQDAVNRLYKHVNKRQFTMFIYAGAFDEFKYNKKTMVENLDALIQYVSFEGALGLDDFVMQKYSDYDENQLKHFEYDVLGFNLVHNQFNDLAPLLEKEGINSVEEVNQRSNQRNVTFIAVIERINEIKTKKGDLMAFVTLSGQYEKVDGVCFPSTYQNYGDLLIQNKIVQINGHSEIKNGKHQIVLQAVSLIKA